jgi:hypothetical protein
MPYSYPFFKNEVKNHIIQKFPHDTEILDVGAGSGVWSDLLYATYKNFDALEIFQPYITQFNLAWRYRNVINGDILFHDISNYQLLIMGDILEHLNYMDASILLMKIHNSNKKCIVAVPYMYPQGAEYGNLHETHLQPDLTHEIFLQRYPMMHTLIKDDKYGYYTNYNPAE